MKVKELIKKLKQVNPEADVILHQIGDNPGVTCNGVQDNTKHGLTTVLLVSDQEDFDD